MTGPAWLIDSKRIASKIKNAYGATDSGRNKWISNPTKACPECNFIIDNSDVVQEWPGLPEGVKFDPSDPELLGHLLAKVETAGAKLHPFINEFIPTVEGDDGICYTHPQKLPGVKKDGSVSHFFHRTFKAYNTGTRKRRKINSDELGDVRWHKTGKTKPVIIDGKHLGCKKIMVLYMSMAKGKKPEKTNWVMHQYHIGTGEDERDGEYVVSKIFYQQLAKPGDKSRQDLVEETFEAAAVVPERTSFLEQITPEYDCVLEDPNILVQEPDQLVNIHQGTGDAELISLPMNEMHDEEHKPRDDTKWWEGESQFLLNSQQLAEGIALCSEFLQSQTSCDGESKNSKPSLLEYGAEDLKRDLEECQNAAFNKNIELDSAAEFHLSQLEFGSQDSFLQGLEANLLND